jgi:hypothetical protein
VVDRLPRLLVQPPPGARRGRTGRYPWLKVLDGTQHFVFLIDGVPVRFYRGDADEPTRRTLRQQEVEAEQLSLAFAGADVAEGLMFRLAVETDEASGMVSRVVFLALRGEEGRAECGRCHAWNWLTAQPERITTIASRPWAQVRQ